MTDQLSPDVLLASYADAWGWETGLPSAYVCVDTETSTFLGRPDAVIVEAGHCIVGGGDILEEGSWILDWTRCPDLVDSRSLAKTMYHTRKNMEFDRQGNPTGRKYKFTLELLKTGVDPIQTLEMYYKLFQDAIETKIFVIGHGVWFDVDFFNHSFKRFLNKPALELSEFIFDTGVIAKALIADLRPKLKEKLPDYFQRVKRFSNSGNKWNLKDLAIRHVPHLVKSGEDLHQAGYDAKMCFHVIEKLRTDFVANQLPSVKHEVTMTRENVVELPAPAPEVKPVKRPRNVRRPYRRGS